MARRQAQKKWPAPFSGGLPIPQQQRTVATHIPAPVGGINTVSPASSMPPSDCLYLFNRIPYQYGLRIRSGFREHVTNLTASTSVTETTTGYDTTGSPMSMSMPGGLGGSSTVTTSTSTVTGTSLTVHPDIYQDTAPLSSFLGATIGGPRVGTWPGLAFPGVRSLLSFAGSSDRGLNDRFFACTREGIYDVTASSSSPTLVYTFPVQDQSSGKGVGCAFTATYSGEHCYAYCDETNGYLLYRESTDAWVKITEGDGTDGLTVKGANPDAFRFVMPWKNRLWFVNANSATAYYLPIGQFAGIIDNNDVTAGGSINFGARFRYGGNLVGLWSWTVDGGVGIDDHLVGISSAGDVVIYTGTDPSTPGTFGLKGVWWVGTVPPGRRIASQFGGDLFILSRTGCLPLSKLVAGFFARDPNIYATAKIGNLFNAFMTERGDIPGWEINIHPTDNLLVINVPATPSKVQELLAMSMVSKGWSRLVGIPMSTMETWRGKLYFGTFDGRVCVNEGFVDDMKLDGTGSYPIDYAVLTSFLSMGNAQKKRLHLVNPRFMTTGTTPAYSTDARWDFDIANVQALPIANDYLETNVWNQGLWNTSQWASGSGTAGSYCGATGMGTHVAILLKGTSNSEDTLVGFDAALDSGGIL